MSVNIEDDEIKLEPESDHDIELESESNEDKNIKLEPDCNEDQDINLEPESNKDQDIKLEPESNEDQDMDLVLEFYEDQDIKVEPESNKDQDIKLEPDCNEDQDINLEPESNKDQDIKLEPESNKDQDIKLEPESNEDQDVNLEMETNEGQDIKLEPLQECQEKLKRINEGKPYFKEKTRLPAPENEDNILMRQSQMYDFSIIKQITGWTDEEKSMFLNVLLKMSQEKKKMEFNTKIAAVRSESKGRKISSTNKKKISTLKQQIDIVDKMELKDVALPLDEEYDWDSVANKMSHRHDALEYKAFWKLYLHPNINKTPLSTSEHTLLLKIASDENLRNWKKIASLLGTGRTSFQCFVYFFTHVHHPLADKKWMKEGEEYLERIVEYYKTGVYTPWGDLAVEQDNNKQSSRPMKSKKGVPKKRFLKEEDEVILICNDKFGENFKKMAKFLPGRSSAQCKKRFQILSKKGVSAEWSIAEDRKLMKFLSHKPSLFNYSDIAQDFPDKDGQHIRSRCTTLRKWMRLNPNVDIAEAPRRASRNLGHRVISPDLHSALKRLKTRIKLEENDKKFKNLNMISSDSDINNALKAILAEEEDGEIEEAKCQLILPDGSDGDQHLMQFNKFGVQNLKRILTLLRARLNKNKFLENPLTEKCKALLEPDQDLLPVIKVKSYSRKKPETIIKVDSDIWGTKCLPPPTYMFPPNYSTIIALRTMLSSISTQSEKNEGGTKFWNSVAIPNPKEKDKVQNVIDLKESASTSNINIDLQSYLRIFQGPHLTEPKSGIDTIPNSLFRKSKQRREYSITTAHSYCDCLPSNIDIGEITALNSGTSPQNKKKKIRFI